MDGARGLSRPQRRRGPAARHRVALFANPALPGGIPQRAILRRAGGARGTVARQAAGTTRRADHADARRSDERSRAALLFRQLPLGLGHHLAARQHLDEGRPRCVDRQGPDGKERLRVLRFAVARRPVVPRLERRREGRRRRHPADRGQAALRRVVVQGLRCGPSLHLDLELLELLAPELVLVGHELGELGACAVGGISRPSLASA